MADSPQPDRQLAAQSAEIDRLRAELARAQGRIDDLEAHADYDPLLDILNRRGFERELARSMAYLSRYDAEAVLIYLDLDDFKAVNDRHGHAGGDAMLKAVAATLLSQVRASDVVARLGGDEFAILMWNVSAALAEDKTRNLESAVSATVVIHGGAALTVGASAGLSWLRSHATPAEAIDAADRAMYDRKNLRRAAAGGIRR